MAIHFQPFAELEVPAGYNEFKCRTKVCYTEMTLRIRPVPQALPIRPVGRGQSLQLPFLAGPSLPSSTPPLLLLLLLSLFYALQLCFFRLFETFKFMATAARWRCMCQTTRGSFRGKLCGRVQGLGMVLGVRGGAAVRRGARRIQTTCNNFVQKFSRLFACRPHNLDFPSFFFLYVLLAHFLALLQCHSGQDTLRIRPRRLRASPMQINSNMRSAPAG